jgi:hypothetical protein
MIEIKELRIGNWLSFLPFTKVNRKDTVKIDSELLTAILRNDEKFYDPIPLTPEILEKAGFKNPEKDLYLIDLNADGKHFTLLKNLNGFVVLSHEITYVLKSVHQLQNLIFALTGNELEINL